MKSFVVKERNNSVPVSIACLFAFVIVCLMGNHVNITGLYVLIVISILLGLIFSLSMFHWRDNITVLGDSFGVTNGAAFKEYKFSQVSKIDVYKDKFSINFNEEVSPITYGRDSDKAELLIEKFSDYGVSVENHY